MKTNKKVISVAKRLDREQWSVFQSELYQTNTTVVVTDDLILITDPTWLPAEIEEIRNFVEERKKNQPVYLLLTHSDFDHVIGAGAFPEATIIASRGFNARSDKEEIVQQMKEFDSAYYIHRSYELQYPKPDIIVDSDEQVLEEGETKITFYLAPGHTVDGLAAVVEPLGLCIAGDYLSNVEIPIIEYHSESYQFTLKKLDELWKDSKYSTVVPGHGLVASKPEEIEKRLRDSEWYIENTKKSLKDPYVESAIFAFIDRHKFEAPLKQVHADNKEQLKTER
jgi:glyoxylase-like metal-dependent hydrolase (beta-lactamase superfamily II)